MTFHDDPARLTKPQLLAYVEDLEHQLREFLVADDGLANLKAKFGVRPSGARLLAQLASGRPCSRERLMAAVCPNPDLDQRQLDVQVCYARQKLAGTGIVISTIWGAGHQITEGAELVRAVMRGETDA